MNHFEFIFEDIDSLTTYLILLGFGINKIRNDANTAIAKFENGEISFQTLDDILFHLSRSIHAIMIGDIWDRFSDDPDRTILYKQISALEKEIDSYLK